MKISVEFAGDETRIKMIGESNAEKHIIGLIYTQKQLIKVQHESDESGYSRSWDSSPDRIVLFLKEPPEEDTVP